MNLPFGLTFERRQASVTNTAIEALLSGATSGTADAAATAAAEACIGAVARPFGYAQVEPAELGAVLTGDVLGRLARSLLTSGNAVLVPDVTPDGLALRGPAVSFHVGGRSLDSQRWGYLIEMAVPSGPPVTLRRPARGIVHIRVNPAPGSPWAGRSPLQLAGLSAQTLANIENSLQHDARPLVGYLLAMPSGATDAQFKQGKTAVLKGRGKMTLVESLKDGLGRGAASAPKGDWEQVRFGADIPGPNIDLRDSTSLRVIEAYGVSPRLFGGSGQDQREARRILYLDVIRPLADVVERAIGGFMGQPVSLTFERGQYRDHRTLANAITKYIEAGYSRAEAAALLGLDT